MSWIEQIKTGYTITTGGGETFSPKWLNASKGIQYNVAFFDFPEIEGTLVKRKKPRGRRYNVEIYFDGDDHLDVAGRFDIAAADSRPLTISHPMYGSLTVQPTGFEFDNRDYNVTKITGTVIETITQTTQAQKKNAQDKIVYDKVQIDAVQAGYFVANIVPETTDITPLSDDALNSYNEGVKNIDNTLDRETYLNAYNAALTGINNIVAEPLQATRTIQRLIEAPYLFAQSVQNRVTTLLNQIGLLRRTIENVLNVKDKRIIEMQYGALITTLSAATVTNISGSYPTRNSVIDIFDSVLDAYNQFILDLDGLQTNDAGGENDYIPHFESMLGISNLVIFTLNSLMDVAMDGRQERTVTLMADSTAIVEAYKYYGNDIDDIALDEFMNINDINLNEMLLIPKGRKLTYFV